MTYPEEGGGVSKQGLHLSHPPVWSNLPLGVGRRRKPKHTDDHKQREKHHKDVLENGGEDRRSETGFFHTWHADGLDGKPAILEEVKILAGPRKRHSIHNCEAELQVATAKAIQVVVKGSDLQ